MRILLTIILLATTLNSYAKAVEISSVRVTESNQQTRVIFAITQQPDSFKVFSIEKRANLPDRVVIDIKSARISGAFNRGNFKQGLVKQLRTGAQEGGNLRIVLDLSTPAKPNSFIVQPTGNQGYRLVVELAHSHRAIIETPGSTTELDTPLKPQQRTRNARQLQKPLRDKIKPVPVRDVIIVIDPGHGGDDSGAIGKLGTREKDVVMGISNELMKLIQRQPGIKAVLVRNSDYYVALQQRLQIARTTKADLFVSVHANSAPQTDARGVSIYTLSKNGASSEAAKWLADRENRSDFVAGVKLEQTPQSDNLAKVLLDLSQTSTLQASVDIAKHVLSELRKIGHVHREGLERAGFLVLKSPDIPSILVETGFISNIEEEKRLRTREYQRQIAQNLLVGIIRYFENNPPPNTRFERRKHLVVEGETLQDIATKYAVSAERLKQANGLRKDAVRSGGVLRIPVPNGS